MARQDNIAGSNYSSRDGADRALGTNQTGVRLYNERLVLSLIRKHGALPKADIARLTGLSPQTISIITNQLGKDGLVIKGAPQRGKVGQPSVPYSLNPDGAYTYGLKIGRRSLDLVLMNFEGKVTAAIHEAYDYPDPARILETTGRGVEELGYTLPRDSRAKISGIGVAAPFEMWNWEHQLGAPKRILDAWRTFDVQRAVARRTGLATHSYNDATAACAAELLLGNPANRLDFLYIFIGSFIGGGLVLDGALIPGRRGYTGAIGPLPVTVVPPATGYEQLIRRASLYVLADRLKAEGRDPSMIWQQPDDWGDLGPPLDDWIEDVARNLALASVSAASLIDLDAIIIDGGMPGSVRAAIVERTNQVINGFDTQGVAPFEVLEGTMGAAARAMGAACLPLLANYMEDRNVLFKERAVR